MVRVQHPWRVLVGGLVAVLVVIGAYAAWLLWDTARNLSAASDDARAMKQAMLASDADAATDAIDDFTEHAATAADRTDSPVWSLLTVAPWLGDDAEGVRTVSRVADDLARQGLGELTGSLGDLDALLPQDSAIDVSRVQGLQEPVANAHEALAAAKERLAREDPSGFVGSLKLEYRDLQRQVNDAADGLAVADRALRVLPAMLGADGPRTYLLVMQNNAEIRATGGLPGSVSLITSEGGRIAMTKQVTANSFSHAPAPVLPLTDEEESLFGQNVGRYFGDANLTPHFPRSATLWRAWWEQVHGEKLDGVISVDAVTLSYLLRALGPVEVAGVQLTADNAVDELLHRVYVRTPEPAAQDAFFREVAAVVFERVMSFDGSPEALLDALRRAAAEHRVLVHSFDDATQAELAGTAVAGELMADAPTTPQVGVYLSDGTLSKMSYFLRYDARVTATSCQDGVQTLTGRLTVRSTAPKDAGRTLPRYVTGVGLPKSSAGMQLVSVQVFGPAGGELSKFDSNGLGFDQTAADFEGRPVRSTWVLLKPGQVKDLRWTMRSGAGQDGDVVLSVTPSITDDSSTVGRSAC